MFLQLVLVKHSQEQKITFHHGKTNSALPAITPNSIHLFQTEHSVGNPDGVTATHTENLATLIGPAHLIYDIF